MAAKLVNFPKPQATQIAEHNTLECLDIVKAITVALEKGEVESLMCCWTSSDGDPNFGVFVPVGGSLVKALGTTDLLREAIMEEIRGQD